jgi:hypothetical protein
MLKSSTEVKKPEDDWRVKMRERQEKEEAQKLQEQVMRGREEERRREREPLIEGRNDRSNMDVVTQIHVCTHLCMYVEGEEPAGSGYPGRHKHKCRYAGPRIHTPLLIHVCMCVCVRVRVCACMYVGGKEAAGGGDPGGTGGGAARAALAGRGEGKGRPRRAQA